MVEEQPNAEPSAIDLGRKVIGPLVTPELELAVAEMVAHLWWIESILEQRAKSHAELDKVVGAQVASSRLQAAHVELGDLFVSLLADRKLRGKASLLLRALTTRANNVMPPHYARRARELIVQLEKRMFVKRTTPKEV